MKNNFLALVLNDLIDKVGFEGLKDYTLVFPMHRAGLFMKQQIKEAIRDKHYDKPVVAPQMMTINELTNTLTQLAPDDEIHSVCRLYRIFKRHTGSTLPLDIFYGWGRQLRQDFSNVDMAMVDSQALFENSVDAHKLEQLDLPKEVSERLEKLFYTAGHDQNNDSYHQSFQLLWEKLPVICQDFKAEQLAAGVGTPGARLRDVVEHLSDYDLSQRKFAFIGFNYLLGAEKALMIALREQSLFYWDYDPQFNANPDAYRFIRMHMHAQKASECLPNALQPEQQQKEKKEVTMISAAGNTVQAEYVHEWLKDKEGSSAVVIADENMLEPVVYALPNNTQKANITKGFPLKNTKIYADIIHYLSDPQLEISNAQTADYAALLDRMMTQLWPAEQNRAAQEDDDQRPISWHDLLQEESKFQALKIVSRFKELLLEKNEDATPLLEINKLKTLRNLLRRMLESATLPFHGEPVTSTQVIGVLETRLLDFDNILILNAEEGVVPQVKNDQSFIPYYLRKYYNLETNDESAAAYAYNFFRLLRRAKNITLCFSNATTGMGKKSMSRFLMQILTSSDFKVKKQTLQEDGEVTSIDSSRLIDPNIRSLRDKWRKQGRYPLTDTKRPSISPSALGNYLECPMRFYLENVLDLSAAETEGTVLEVNELGSLIHAAIENAYKKILPNEKSGEVDPKKIEAFLANPDNIQMALQAAYEEINLAYLKHHPKESDKAKLSNHYRMDEHQAENEVVIAHMKKVLCNDQQTKSLYIAEMEKWKTYPIPLTLSNGEQITVECGGFIDRLDIAEINGKLRLRVLDYKTGSFDPEKMQADSMEEIFGSDGKKRYMLQTLIYCLACMGDSASTAPDQPGYNKPIIPSLLFTRNSIENFDPLLHLGEDKRPILDFKSECAELFLEQLKNLLKQIIEDTEFKQCDPDKCSKYCPFHALCGREKKEW